MNSAAPDGHPRCGLSAFFEWIELFDLHAKKPRKFALEKTSLMLCSPPSFCHQSPKRGTGFKGDDAVTGNTKPSQPGVLQRPRGYRQRLPEPPGSVIAIQFEDFSRAVILFCDLNFLCFCSLPLGFMTGFISVKTCSGQHNPTSPAHPILLIQRPPLRQRSALRP